MPYINSLALKNAMKSTDNNTTALKVLRLLDCFKEYAVFFYFKWEVSVVHYFKKYFKKHMGRIQFWSKSQVSLSLKGISSRSQPAQEPVSGNRRTGWAEGNFPASGRQRLPRLVHIKLNSLGMWAGTGISLPVLQTWRQGRGWCCCLAPCWPACSCAILEAKRIY